VRAIIFGAPDLGRSVPIWGQRKPEFGFYRVPRLLISKRFDTARFLEKPSKIKGRQWTLTPLISVRIKPGANGATAELTIRDQYKAVAETALERAKAILSAVNKQEEAE
jgi:hypothetical protein